MSLSRVTNGRPVRGARELAEDAVHGSWPTVVPYVKKLVLTFMRSEVARVRASTAKFKEFHVEVQRARVHWVG